MKLRRKFGLFCALVLAVCFAAGTMAGCKDKDKTLVVGITEYEPMDYKDADGEWKGFDYELAKSVLGDMGYKVKFTLIDWETKIMALKAREIDVIWNGMTVTEELQENILLSDTYLQNRQYGVVKTQDANTYTSVASLASASVAVEAGSAAQNLLTKEDNTYLCKKLIKAENQNKALLEVASNAADVAVVDYLLAKSLTENTASSYYGKLVAADLGFAPENFAIGFRKSDTSLCAAVNEKIAAFYADGTIAALAKKYGIENQLVAE